MQDVVSPGKELLRLTREGGKTNQESDPPLLQITKTLAGIIPLCWVCACVQVRAIVCSQKECGDVLN